MDRCGEDAMRQYLLHKHRLSEGKMEGVNWEAVAGYLRSLPPFRLATQVKLQHNWIPTNSFLFQQRRVQCDKCPLCESAVETASHIRWCKAPVAQAFRRGRLEQLVRELKGINTAPEIIQCWREQIAFVSGDEGDGEEVIGPLGGVLEINRLVVDRRRHQSVLPWEGLLQGRASKYWTQAQASHERWRRQETASHGRRRLWDFQAVRLLCEYNGALWSFRNDEVHGRTMQEAQQKLRASVEAKVRNLYERHPIFCWLGTPAFGQFHWRYD